MSLTPARLIKVHKEFNSHCSLIQVCVRQFLRQTMWDRSSPNNRPRHHPTSAE